LHPERKEQHDMRDRYKTRKVKKKKEGKVSYFDNRRRR
jgi:hypothetical protein